MSTHLSSAQSHVIDQKLMSPEYGFSTDQLMEMAGMSVAHACVKSFPSVGKCLGEFIII